MIPVTPLQQNCSLVWCTATKRGAFVDPGGDLPKLRAAIAQTGVTIEKILLTHGHIDHCGQAGMLAKELGVPIEGPHEEDRFWIARLEEDGRSYLVAAQMLKALGVTNIALLSNNPDKGGQLRRFGVAVTSCMPTGVHLSPANARYLATKAQRGAHTLDVPLSAG